MKQEKATQITVIGDVVHIERRIVEWPSDCECVAVPIEQQHNYIATSVSVVHTHTHSNARSDDAKISVGRRLLCLLQVRHSHT